MTDLAVLGPVDVSARPLKLEDGEDTAIGSELLLVGYPGEVDLFPQPSITRGILSRFREWERLGITYFQTDASITGGQSGGVLLNSRGEVIGISGFLFSEAGFGLAASSADIVPIVERLAQGEFTSGLGDRRLPEGRGSFEFDIDLRNHWDTRMFVLEATQGTMFEVEIEGSGDGWFRVSDPFGLVLEVDDGYTGIEHGTVELLTSGVHFLQVEMASGESSTFHLVSSVRLKPVSDPDDGRTIAVGDTIAGSIDSFSDWDWYSINLIEGETVKISTDSLNVDSIIYVDFPNSRDNQVVYDDDSGGGLFGVNSELVYRAPKTGEYFIAITEAVGDSSGGYYLSVEWAQEHTETVYVPPDPDVVDSSFGPMMVFEDPQGYFSVQIPYPWLEKESDPLQSEIFRAIDPTGDSQVLIIEEDVLGHGVGQLSLTEYADLIESSVIIPSGSEDITRKTILTSQGGAAVRFEMSWFNSRVFRLIYMLDNNVAASIGYSFPAELADQGERLADYSFRSFRERELSAPEDRPFDEGADRISHGMIQWDQYPTYDGRSVSFRGTLLDDAVLSYSNISQARGGGYSNFSLSPADGYDYSGSVLPALGGWEWTLDEPGDSIATVYQLDERAFTVEFPFPQALENPSDYVVVVWGYEDETRTPRIAPNIDVLGYARIREE